MNFSHYNINSLNKVYFNFLLLNDASGEVMKQRIFIHDEKCGHFCLKISLLWGKMRLVVRYVIELCFTTCRWIRVLNLNPCKNPIEMI